MPILAGLAWLATKIAAFISTGLAFLAAAASKKLGLGFVYITLFVTILGVALACINLIIDPLLAPLAALSGPLFTGLTYVIPQIFDVAISAMISARICVWLFIQHYIMIKLVSES